MEDVPVMTTSGGVVTLREPVLKALRANLSGRILTSGSDEYDEARAV